MSIELNLSDFNSIMCQLDPSVIKKATKRTLEELMSSGMTAAVKEVTSVYNMKSSDLKRSIGSKHVSSDGMEISVLIKSDSYVSMVNFIQKSSISNSINKKNKDRKNKVTVKIIKGGGTKMFRHAFLMIGKNGNIGIFGRKILGSKKIERLNTAGPVVMFRKIGEPLIQKSVNEKASDVFSRNLAFYRDQAGRK